MIENKNKFSYEITKSNNGNSQEKINQESRIEKRTQNKENKSNNEINSKLSNNEDNFIVFEDINEKVLTKDNKYSYDHNNKFNIDSFGGDKLKMDYNKNNLDIDLKDNKVGKNRITLESKQKLNKDVEILVQKANDNLNQLEMENHQKKEYLFRQDNKLKETMLINKDITPNWDKKNNELKQLKDQLKEVKLEYDRIKRVEQIKEIERDLEVIRKENIEYRRFLHKKKDEIFQSELASDNLEKFKRLYNENLQFSKQLTENEFKMNRNSFYIQEFKKKTFELKDELDVLKKEENLLYTKEMKIIEKVLSSLEHELEGVPIQIIDKINNNIVTLNKERKELITIYENLNQISPFKKSFNKFGGSPVVKRNNCDLNNIDKRLFESIDKQGFYNNINNLDESAQLEYDDVNENEYLNIIKRKELLVLENERIEKLVMQNKDEYDNINGQMKIAIEHQQKRLIMLREQNEYLSKEIIDLMELIVIKYNEEKLKNEISKIAMTFDQNPEESKKKLAILNEIYNSIKKKKNV